MNFYGLLVGLAIVVVLEGVRRIVERERWTLSVDRYAVFMLIFGLVGARAYHVLSEWSLYVDGQWWMALAVWRGGLGVIGALIGAVIGAIVCSVLTGQRHQLWQLFDAVAVFVPLGQSIGRWGNFVNQELYGHPTTFPWAISIDGVQGVRFHPLFVYESLLTVLLHLFLLRSYLSGRVKIGSGWYACVYMMGYAMIRFVLEFLRSETVRLTYPVFDLLSLAQWWMLALCIIAGVIVWRKKSGWSV